MSIREDFYDVAYELAKIANKEKKKIKNRALETIKFLKNDTDQRIHQIINQLEKTQMYDELYKLNIDESERIAEINQKVAEQKGKYIPDFIHLLKQEIRKKINRNTQKYYDFLFRKIKEFIPLFDQDVKIFFNKHDLEFINKKPRFNQFQTHEYHITISQTPIETVAGFIIKPFDESYKIEYTFESQIEKNKQELSMRFMEIFPVFEVDVKNAIDIEKEKYGERHQNV
jgi:vacuolar-type H+-ATPase subunit E/Vma4